MARRLLLLAAASLLAGPAVAQQMQTPEAAGFTQLFISPCGEPYRGRPGDPYPVVLWFRQADANHDGAVDRVEFRADHAGFFDALDADANGYLDGAEVAFYEHKVVPDVMQSENLSLRSGLILVQGRAAGPQGQINEARRQAPRVLYGAAPYGLIPEAEPVRAADTDLNGRVTKAEFLAAADRRFARLDGNGDSRLELAELPRTSVQPR